MFEKEAQYYAFDEVKHKQEWYIKHPERSIDEDYEDIKKHWGKGAEFGYNKANEWYYPSKGEYPKTKKKVLVLLKDVEEPILDYYRQDGLWIYALEKEVIAWKEIVLLEEK